jgi:hypothetical protein
MKGFRNLIAIAAAAAICVPAMAQETTTAQPKYTINQRKDNQQQRIGNGVENGSLTAGETHRLEKQETHLNAEQHHMRAEDSGKLTAADRARLQHQDNHLSGEIYRDKHNAAHQNVNPTTEVGQRQRLQQERIGQGIKSGQLTAREATHTEGHEAAVNHEIARDRAANGGALTRGERARVNRQQNRNSRRIYNKKHNGRVRG